MKEDPTLQMRTDKMIPRHVCDKLFMVRFLDRSEGKDGFKPDRKGGLLWYTDGSKTNKGTGTGVCGYGTRQNLSFSRGKYAKVLQAEVYAIKAYAVEILDRDYRNRNIGILSDSQALIKST
jgi:hypothetical protein